MMVTPHHEVTIFTCLLICACACYTNGIAHHSRINSPEGRKLPESNPTEKTLKNYQIWSEWADSSDPDLDYYSQFLNPRSQQIGHPPATRNVGFNQNDQNSDTRIVLSPDGMVILNQDPFESNPETSNDDYLFWNLEANLGPNLNPNIEPRSNGWMDSTDQGGYPRSSGNSNMNQLILNQRLPHNGRHREKRAASDGISIPHENLDDFGVWNIGSDIIPHLQNWKEIQDRGLPLDHSPKGSNDVLNENSYKINPEHLKSLARIGYHPRIGNLLGINSDPELLRSYVNKLHQAKMLRSPIRQFTLNSRSVPAESSDWQFEEDVPIDLGSYPLQDPLGHIYAVGEDSNEPPPQHTHFAYKKSGYAPRNSKRWWGAYYRPRPKMDRRAAQSKHYGCLKTCISVGKLHPIQCHTLC